MQTHQYSTRSGKSNSRTLIARNMENDEYTFYKCKKNNWSLERKGAYKNIFRVKQRQTIFYFSESQKPLLYVPKRIEQIESAPSKRGCYLGLGCGIGWQNKKMHLFQGRLRGGLFSLSCEVFIAFKSANHWHWWDELDCALYAVIYTHCHGWTMAKVSRHSNQ